MSGVLELNRADVVEVYEIWKLLGPMATARAARTASRDQILQAVQLAARMRGEPAGLRWAEYNLRFHCLIEGPGSGPRLTAILSDMRELAAQYVSRAVLAEPEVVAEANAEHEEILRAIIDRDAEAAAEAALRHLKGRLDAMLTLRPVPAARTTVSGPLFLNGPC